MKSISLNAHAKINLSLDVIRKRQDGYHDVRMIMQSIDLHDEVVVETRDTGIEVECDKPWVPGGKDNIAYKAANLMMERYKIESGVGIKIYKRIPVAAGLAGGSADAAAVIKGMNELFSLNLNEAELMNIGKQVGADVPFCIKGGTMLSEGIGEKLTKIPSFQGVDIVLVKPKVGVSTAWVYNNLKLDKISSRPDTDLLIKAISEKDIGCLAQNMGNVLETVTIEKYEVINDIKNELLRLGALGSMMSGSGPSVFGIFENGKKACLAYESLKDGEWECFMTQTI
ncbi:4-(cytidine 5'-diphospho)-2-C-methyl-D-erythritol kinase [Acetivibrio straminisolvens]|jgi:4-diphosphocytidyl-2-C-methyl-D-erythritol kinase|uniref:4-diphosphocytidyl-2-C-methyl-D-erythritol kinase n=1 Tax=Acetivibrio straminisolvens JCM 21531 TaxID=1294263 RepID=W4V5W6_9FIRM|nr:4-(cytidine 5'-diphospho)-2-C-methyl-D-erythritol kinase [Acetivibrio straminisolvens]GAE88562.1 4-diphosphocytidyl-2-C-methyl-D-erythritol kinase [Acetivibrio straminisolvens JCM 21531]